LIADRQRLPGGREHVVVVVADALTGVDRRRLTRREIEAVQPAAPTGVRAAGIHD